MKDFITILAAAGLLFGAYGLILCKTAAKRTPKPGEDYDERGTYECDGDCLHSGRKK
jgi:hypothetical protein